MKASRRSRGIAAWLLLFLGAGLAVIVLAQTITEFPIPTANGEPFGITAGPDGALWFAEGVGQIGRITTAGGPSGSVFAYWIIGCTPSN